MYISQMIVAMFFGNSDNGLYCVLVMTPPAILYMGEDKYESK